MNKFKKIVFVFAIILVLLGVSDDAHAATVVFSGTESQLMSQYGTLIHQDMLSNGGVTQGSAGIYAGNGGSSLDRICQLIDPTSTATYFGQDDYASPGNNTIVKWNGSSWSKHGASNYNNHLRGSLTCTSYAPPAPVNYAAYCGDGIKNQTWEQCDGGNSCTNQCQDSTSNQCSELILAKVKVTAFDNDFNTYPGSGSGSGSGGGGSYGPYYKMMKAVTKTVHAAVYGGNMTSDIFVGNSLNRIPEGTWFPVYYNGSYYNDPSISGYENVPGIAIQRTQGKITALMHGSNTSGVAEHIKGYIELWNATVTTQSNNTSGNNKFEKPTDGQMEINPFQDEYWKSGGKSHFWSTVTAQDDSFHTNYSASTPICVAPPAPQPTLTFTPSPTIIDNGDSATVTWNSDNTTSCTGTNFNTSGATSGSITVYPSVDTTYGISCTGSYGSITGSETIYVTQSPAVNFNASPSNIDAGDPATITWTSANTTSCTGTNFNTSGATSGSITVYPSVNTTYEISCTGPGGDVDDNDTVYVTPSPVAPTADLDLSPTTNVDPGDDVQLTWTSTNTTTCVGTNFSTGGATSGSITVYPFSNTTYSVLCTGPGGTATDGDTVLVNASPTVDLEGDPTTIDVGDDTELTWDSDNTTTCVGTNFSTGGATSGSITVSPSVTTTYGISCTGPNGTVTDSVTITVNTGGGGDAPTCTLGASPKNITIGVTTELTWTSTNATSVSIDNGVGIITPVGSGDYDITPSSTTTYTATFTGPGGTTTCSEEITVDIPPGTCVGNCGGGGGPPFDPHISLTINDNPGEQPLAFVSLSAIPYTGFGAGPIVTALFWMIVLAISAVLGHIIVSRGVMQKFMNLVAQQSATMYKNNAQDNNMNFTEPVDTDDAIEEEEEKTTSDPKDLSGLSGTLESRAHEENILVSSEGLNIVIGLGGGTEHGAFEILETLLKRAKDTYPREDGWILLNTKRVHNLLPHTTVPNTPKEEEEIEIEEEDKVQAPTEDDNGKEVVVDNNALVIDFIKNIILKDVNKTFEILRDVKEMTPPEFIAQVVCTLDEVYKDRLEGYRNKNEEISKLLSDWTDDSLEGVIEILAEAIDHSYKSNRIGVKVALTKMFNFLG